MSQLQDLQAQITKYEQAAQQAGLQTPQGQALYQNVCRMKQKLLAIQNGAAASTSAEMLQGLRPANAPVGAGGMQPATQHFVKAIAELKEKLSKIKAELSRPNLTPREKEELEKEHNEKVAALNAYHMHIQKANQPFHPIQQQVQNVQENPIPIGNMYQGTPVMPKVQQNQATINMAMQQRAPIRPINQMQMQAQQVNKNQASMAPGIQSYRQNPIAVPKASSSSVHPTANLPFQPPAGQIMQNTSVPTSFEKMPPVPEVLNLKPPVPVAVPPARPTLTSGYTTTPLMSTPGISKPPQYDIDNNNRILSKRKLQELVKQINPNERLDPDVADEFVESVVSFACRLAKYRKSDTLDVKDVQLHLERNWNIRIPGYTSDEIRSEDDDGIDVTSLKEIWRGQKGAELPEWSRWFCGIRSPVTNAKLYTLAASLKSKHPLKSEEKHNYLEEHAEKKESHHFRKESPCEVFFEQNHEYLSQKKTTKPNNFFSRFPGINVLKKKECVRTLECDLKTSDPPTFIDMYGTISENNKEVQCLSNSTELLSQNIYKEEIQQPLMHDSKGLYSSTEMNLLLSKLLDCFSKQPKILETRGTQTSKHTTPITKMCNICLSYPQITSSTNSSASQIFLDAKESFSNSSKKLDKYGLKKEKNTRYQNKEDSSVYSGTHCLCQKISLKRSLFPPNISPCNLYTIRNAGNYTPEKYRFRSKHTNYPFERKAQVSPHFQKNIRSSQTNIYPFTPFVKPSHQPMRIFQEDTSPDFIIQKKISSSFLHETKTNSSDLQYYKPMVYENGSTSKEYIKKESIHNKPLKTKPKITYKEKISFREKKHDTLSTANSISYCEDSVDDIFNTHKQGNTLYSGLSPLSTSSDKLNVSTILHTKATSKNNLESISNCEKDLKKKHYIKKNKSPTQLSTNDKNVYFTRTNLKKKGKIRIPSIFLNNHETSLSKSKTSKSDTSSQNIKINTKNIVLKKDEPIKNINKKENLKSRDFEISNNKKSSYNETCALKKDEINIKLFQSSTKKEEKNHKTYIPNLDTQNSNTSQALKDFQKRKSSPLVSKKTSISQSFKKPSNDYLSTCNTSKINCEKLSENDKNIKKKTDPSNTRNKVIIPPIFLLQKNNNNVTNSNVFKESRVLHDISSNSINSNEVRKEDFLINTKQPYTENTTFSQESITKHIQDKSNPLIPVTVDYKYKYKNHLIDSESSNLKKTKTCAKDTISTNFSTKNTKNDTENVLSRHKHLVSAYQEAVNMSTVPYKVVKIDAFNRTHPSKIIIPSIFTS
ncbi:hypothetical protein PORY_001967 [Pneumocystis oryctolagi]|uniref:Uncharacterized protein n=1 Tax=Pneumocystis oryctolagi TaxID=42067 RepID=A0ACB7CCJ7_9ASCO|nr:hypothetical protein PORY_001967 [Pneumocystis oryctolagi]